MTNREIDRLTQTLENGNRSYYVYALCMDDGTPFYIGKGRGARFFAHELEADDAAVVLNQLREDHELTDEEFAIAQSRLSIKLQTLIKAKGLIKRVVVKWGLTESEAFMCESAMINLLGFIEGITVMELTNIANGHASDPEKNSVSDVKTKARTIEEFLSECAISEKPIDDLHEKIVFIKINDFYPRCLGENGAPDVFKIRESVRGVWRIHASRRNVLEYVFALYHGRVVGVFHVKGVSRSVGYECKHGANDYPQFPEDIREVERVGLGFDSLEDAKASLSLKNYERLDRFLSNGADRRHKTKAEVFADLQRRVYLHVDDNVPSHLTSFLNSIVTRNGSRRAFCGQNPICYNF